MERRAGVNHYVVLKSVTLYHVIIHDPASGVKRLSMSDVNASFTGVALELRPDEGFKPRQARSRLKLRQLCGNIGGLSRSVTQVVVLSLAIEVLSLVSPFFLQWTLDHVLLTNDKGLLITLAIGFGVLLVTQQAITAAREWVMLYVSTMINVQWKRNVFKHLVALPVEFFEKRQLGDVISRFGEVDEIQGALTGTFFSAVLDGLMAFITGVLMAVYSPKLFGIAVLAMLGYVVTRCIFYYPLRNSLSEQVVHAAHQQTHFLETIRAVRTIKLFQREQERCSTWTALLVRQINAGLKTHKIQLLYSHINGLIFGVENLVAVSIGALIVMETNLTIGTLMAFLAYKSQFLGRVMSLIDQIFTMSLLRIHTERLGDVVLHPPETTETPLALELVNDAAATIKVVVTTINRVLVILFLQFACLNSLNASARVPHVTEITDFGINQFERRMSSSSCFVRAPAGNYEFSDVIEHALCQDAGLRAAMHFTDEQLAEIDVLSRRH